MDSKKEKQSVSRWSMIEGLVRAESTGITGDIDKNNFREMEGATANQQGIEE